MIRFVEPPMFWRVRTLHRISIWLLLILAVGFFAYPTPVYSQIAPVKNDKDWKPIPQLFDSVEMVLVPPGCFMMGSADEQIGAVFQEIEKDGDSEVRLDWFDNEKPSHKVCFESAFWIDKYEVSNGQFKQFSGKAGRKSQWTQANYPREFITWQEAQNFCEKRGARLPTEAEWEYAARGPDGVLFPWGNVFDPDLAFFKTNSDDKTADVDSRPGGASWVGALQLSGNVWEWVADLYVQDYYKSSGVTNPQGPTTNKNKMHVIRGGAWSDGWYLLRSTHRHPKDPAIASPGGGFRCARSK